MRSSITGELNIDHEEFRHVADLLLGKNIIESLENDRFRFVHDQMKGFIQREWLAAKMSNWEKLRAETETALQMLFLSPEDEITVSFNILPVAMCCFKSLFLYDIDNLSRVLEQVATLKHRSAADLCAVVSAATFRCASRNVFNNLRSKLVSLLEKNEFYPQTSMMLAIEIINGEKSDWNTAQKAIDLAEKLATEEKNSREGDLKAMGYYMLAASWAKAIDDFPRKDILFGKFTKILYEILQRKEESEQVFDWPNIKKGPIRINRTWTYNSSMSLSEAASWTRQMGYFQEQNELLKRGLEFAIEEANKEEEVGKFSMAFHSYAEAADFAEKMGDEKRRSELYAKAIDLGLKCPEKEKKETLFSGPSVYYAQAADFAEKIWDKKLRSELYETAIDLRVRYAEEKEKEENYSEALRSYAAAADWADKMEDEKRRKELYEKAIEVGLRSATTKEKRSSLSSAAADYVQTAKWADAVRDNSKRDTLYEKAAQSLREAAETYEKLASFLLNSETLIAASALRDYFSEDAEKFAYFDKISSIVENCRWFFEDFSGMSRWR